jgi:hypothetical protein
MILAVLIDADVRPVCSETWPDDTADVTTLIPAPSPFESSPITLRSSDKRAQPRMPDCLNLPSSLLN